MPTGQPTSIWRVTVAPSSCTMGCWQRPLALERAAAHCSPIMRNNVPILKMGTEDIRQYIWLLSLEMSLKIERLSEKQWS
jgi:hypothetical protein